MIGSFISMIASIVVALLYIRNQNSSEKKRLFNENLQKGYFEQGILPIQEALSIYGTAVIFVCKIRDMNLENDLLTV